LKQDDFNKIECYINGEADDSEKEYVESLFLNGEDNYTLRNLLDKDFKTMLAGDSPSEANLLPILDRVHHIIRKNETNKKQKPLRRLVDVYMKAAAILLLPLLIAGGMVYSYLGNHGKMITDRQVNSTIYAPMAARVSFNLPDGTTGMLNSGSRLSYSLPFTNNRQVKLEGEAWLEVSRDEKHPFEINAGNSKVKVLGTSFNLSAYPAENYIEVVLQEGKVEFQAEKGEVVTLYPSERLVSQDGNLHKAVVDPEKYNAWTEGRLVFRGDPMAEVARRIERWYNVKINLADRELEKYSFRATFQDDTLDDALRFLAMTSPINYKISPREMMTDGSFKKEEVTIYKRR